MKYVDFEAGNKAYKLRLNTRNTVALEKAIGCNPLSIFGAGDTIPSVTILVQILHASLQQYHHGITLNDAFDIFDTYLEDEHSVTDFLPTVLEIYQVSGILPKGNTEKN
jgi:hypothetical protein